MQQQWHIALLTSCLASCSRFSWSSLSRASLKSLVRPCRCGGVGVYTLLIRYTVYVGVYTLLIHCICTVLWNGWLHVYVLIGRVLTNLRVQDDVTGSIVRERFLHLSFQSPITVPHSLSQYTPINNSPYLNLYRNNYTCNTVCLWSTHVHTERGCTDRISYWQV